MIKKGISNKILGSYVVLIVLIFIITNVTFGFLSKRYLTNELKGELEEEASSIQKMIDSMNNTDALPWEDHLLLRRRLKPLGNLLDSNIIIHTLEKPAKVIFTNVDVQDRVEIVSQIRNETLDERNVVFYDTIYVDKQPVARIVLFTGQQTLKSLNQIIRRTQFISLSIGLFVALILATLLGKKITKPIKSLQNNMSQYELGSHSKIESIRSGDEIEVLSNTFIGLVEKIEYYNASQKSILQNTSHELKTPIMSIQGYAEGILDGVLAGDEAEDGLNIIVSESKRLKKAIDEMLFLSKLESSHDPLKMEFVPIEELIQAAIKRTKPIADGKKIALKWVALDDSPSELWIDGDKMLRCLINLIGNAIRFAKEEILIETRFSKCIEIVIKDDGPGFSEEAKLKAFQRFYKGDSAGTGLGLTLCKAIVEAHHGTISIYNSETGGGVVTITLPTLLKN